MTLFSREPDNSKSTASLKAALPSTSPAVAAGTETALYEEVQTPSRTPGPAAQGAQVRTYLDKGSKISGKLFFEEPVKIDGQVDGDISAKDTVVIGETALVNANLKAASVVITGKISGNVSATKRVEIRPMAMVSGNLITPILVIYDGARFEGHCTMNPETKEDRKGTPAAPKGERVIPQAAPSGK